MQKILLFALALTASLCAYAQESAAPADVVAYTYGMHLDIAQVLNMSPVPEVCGPAPMHMTYRDSQGQTHVLEYSVLGNGCSN